MGTRKLELGSAKADRTLHTAAALQITAAGIY